jgi:hypothetical protein
MAGKEDHSFSQDFNKLHVELVRLGGDGAPCVLHVENAFSKEFLVEDEKQTNKTHYCQDTNSGGGSSSIGAFFRCKTCHEKTKEEGADSEKTVMCPLVRVGENNSVCSVPASEWSVAKQAMASEIANMFSISTNQILAAIRQGLTNKNDGVGNGQDDAPMEEASIEGLIVGQDGEDMQIDDETTSVPSIEYLTPEQIETAVKGLIWDGTNSRGNKTDLSSLSVEDLKDVTNQQCNLDISKIGAKAVFARHADSSLILNSTNHGIQQCVANNDVLPLRQEMPVVTFVTGKGECTAKLSWYQKATFLGSVTTTGNSVHIQLPGVQWDNIKHESALANKKAQRAMLLAGGVPVLHQINTYRHIQTGSVLRVRRGIQGRHSSR